MATGWPPRPRSTAYLIPISAGAGSRAAAAACPMAAAAGPAWRAAAGRAPGLADRGPERQHGGDRHGDQPAGRQQQRRNPQTAGRAVGEPGYADRGQRGEGDRQAGRARGPGHADRHGARQIGQHELARGQAQRGQRPVVGALGDRLPGDGLRGHRQRGERSQCRQHVPAGDLRVDRRAGGVRVGVEVVGAQDAVRVQRAADRGQVCLAVPQPQEGQGQRGRARVDRGGERGGGEQVVVRQPAAGELAVGGGDAHHPEVAGLAGLRVGGAGQRRPRVDRDADHRPNADAVVLGQGERGQHLVGPGLDRKPAGQKSSSCGRGRPGAPR